MAEVKRPNDEISNDLWYETKLPPRSREKLRRDKFFELLQDFISGTSDHHLNRHNYNHRPSLLPIITENVNANL